MNPNPRTVLFRPSGRDPYGVLLAGPCGTRPPTAGLLSKYGFDRVKCTKDDVWIAYGAPEWDDPGTQGDALALAFDGDVIPEGCDRLIRALRARRPDAVGFALSPTYGDVAQVLNLARHAEQLGIGDYIAY